MLNTLAIVLLLGGIFYTFYNMSKDYNLITKDKYGN